MVKSKSIIIGALVLAVGIGLAFYLSPSEEKKIKNQFRLLAEWVSKEPGETPMTMAHKAKNIGTLFDRTCEFKIPAYSFSGSYTPEEISGYATRGRLSFSQLDLRFYDLHIAFPEKGVARVTFTARLTGKLTVGESVDEVHEIESILRKIEKEWLFSQLEAVEVLKK